MEEQQLELEALQSIYGEEEFSSYSGRLPDGWDGTSPSYRIAIDPTDEQPAGGFAGRLELLFQHTPRYPEEPPRLRLRAVRGLSDADVSSAQAMLEAQAEAGVGAAVIFDLVTAAREWLDGRAGAPQAAEELDPIKV